MKVSDNGAASEPYSSTELYSGSWRQRPQRAFRHKTLTLATPSQPTRTAHTRAGCPTTGSRAWASMWESSTLQGSSHLQVCAATVAYRVVSRTRLTPYCHLMPTMPDLQCVPSGPVWRAPFLHNSISHLQDECQSC